jgi:hypothetical protein
MATIGLIPSLLPLPDLATLRVLWLNQIRIKLVKIKGQLTLRLALLRTV